MARQIRFDPPGGVHHVMHRGSRRQLIFEDDGDRHEFLARVAAVHERCNIHIHAFALMPNHYHLLVECPEGGLSTAMKQLNSAYAQWFNWRHTYDGHLFRGRFRSILIGDDSYLVELARYIHRNSLSAGLVERPESDPWSSHRLYVGGSGIPWLHTERILRYFGSSRERFAAFVAAPDSIAARTVLEAVDERRPAIGDPTFLTNLALSTEPVAATACSLRRLAPTPIEDLLARTASEFASEGVLSSHIAMAAARRAGASFRAIADHFGMQQTSTVRSCVHRLEKRASADPSIERLISDALRTT